MVKANKTPPKSVKTLRFSPEQVHAFRLRRHHLVDEPGEDIGTICRDVCGVQAQVLTAAQLQLWARNPAITPAAVNEALWQKRSLVKTSLMRQTLHLIPTQDFTLYIAANRSARVKAVLSVMARFKITRDEADALSGLILETLKSGPAPHVAIRSAVRPRVSKRVRAWMDRVSSIVRLPVADGLICYGPGEGNQATFIRTEQWLPLQDPVDETEARVELMRRYLRAYGPATLKDFAYWCGISMTEAGAIRPLLEAELVDQNGLLLMRADLKTMEAGAGRTSPVQLLPHFDVYLLAHSRKDHLVEERFYKRVFRSQWWISPVVLIDGRIAGVWSYELGRQNIEVAIELFSRVTRSCREEIKARAQSLAGFFQRTLSLSFKA
jgi:Winged helix DNA-binding domain